jgi:hypothetical protein
MKLIYDPKADAAAVLVRGDLAPGERDGFERLDADRFVHFDASDHVVEYQFLNVRRFGVRLDDIEDVEHRRELSHLFRDAGFTERDWGHPLPAQNPRRDTAAG